ncbi:MAG: VOC family protein [Planctomycetes bacterium]|nr:VOC family protein [Planctomycetota bacterium]
MIKGLAHVCFFVRDLEASTVFYRDLLGLKPAFEFHRDDGAKFGQYLHVGDRAFIELFQRKPGDPIGEPTSYHHFCLEVEDIESTAAELRRRGVEVGEIKKGSDHSWQAWLTDPDGNRIELHDYTAESKQRPYLA